MLYPVNTGETTFVKDSADNKIKLLDTVIQLLRVADTSEASTRANAISTLQTALDALETNVTAAQSKADSAYSLAQTANNNAGSSYIMRRNKDNTPSSNNAYDLGSSSYQWANVFSRAMTIGREGYEWDINTNDGYVILPGGVLVHWGRVSRTSSGYATVSFVPSFKYAPTLITTCAYNANDYFTSNGNGYVANVSSTSAKVGTIDSYYTYWVAIGQPAS